MSYVSLMHYMVSMCMPYMVLHFPAKKGENLAVVKPDSREPDSRETWVDLGLCLQCSIGMCLCLFYQWFSTSPQRKGCEKTLALSHRIGWSYQGLCLLGV